MYQSLVFPGLLYGIQAVVAVVASPGPAVAQGLFVLAASGQGCHGSAVPELRWLRLYGA